MKIIDKYILKIFLKNLFIGITGSLLIFFSKELLKIIYHLTNGNINSYEARMLALYSIPSVLSFDMLHLASIFGSLLTMSRLNENLELVAMKTSGIKFIRIILSPLIFTLFISLLIYLFTEHISVLSNKKADAIWNKSKEYKFDVIKTNVYFKGKENYFIKIGKISGLTNKVEHIQIVYLNQNFSKISKVFYSTKGKYDGENWIFKKLNEFDLENNKNIIHENYILKLSEKPNDFLRKSYPKEEAQKNLSIKEIKENILFLQSSGGNYNMLLNHLHHRRLAYPFAFFAMTIMGLSIATKFSRGGKGLSMALGMLIGFLYYILAEIFFALGLGKIIPTILSAWISNILFLVIGTVLIRKSEY